MIKAEIVVDFPKWKTKIKNPSLYFKKKIKKLSCVKSLKKKNFQFTLLLTNKTFIKKLNKRFRKKNKETDVLSFPIKSHYNKNYKGDIAICYEIINLRSKKLLGHLDEISVVDFDHTDVVRHPLVSKIVKAYSDQNKD